MLNCHLVVAVLIFSGSVPATASGSSPGESAKDVAEGAWDLTWQTRRGPQRSGFLVLKVDGMRLLARIHGKGSVSARGIVSGSSFHLTGARMLTPYRIDGEIQGDQMQGSLRILSVERRFTGVRRPTSR